MLGPLLLDVPTTAARPSRGRSRLAAGPAVALARGVDDADLDRALLRAVELASATSANWLGPLN